MDLDGTVVPEKSYLLLLLVFTGVFVSFPVQFVLVLMSLVCIPVKPLPLHNVDDVFINTARPWPLVSPKTLWVLSVPFDHVYFRSAWNTVDSKIINMKKIQARTKKKPSELWLYDNHRSIVDAVEKEGFRSILVDQEF